jgi:predicted YcjX-like family ATPase
MENIQKPITVVRQEFIEKMVNEINTCGLPLWAIEPILEDLLRLVKAESQRQYETERVQYEQALAAQKDE